MIIDIKVEIERIFNFILILKIRFNLIYISIRDKHTILGGVNDEYI